MFVITVYPLLVPFPPHSGGHFSYFFKEKIPLGALVQVPFGKRVVPAVVASCRTLAEEKTRVKTQKFSLKRVRTVLATEPFFSPELLKLSEVIANYYISSPGTLLNYFLPARLITKPPVISATLPKRAGGKHTHQLYLGPQKERYDAYERRITDTLSHSSVFMILPTIALVKYAEERFAEHEPIIIHSRLRVKALREAWEKARSGKRVLIIGTATAIGATPEDVGVLLLDDVHSPHFRTKHHPLFNLRNAISYFALSYNATLIEGSASILPEDVAYKEPRGTTITVLTPPHHVSAPSVVDMTKETTQEKFPILSKFLIDRIVRERGRTILFGYRKGYAPLLICRDCGTVVDCPTCDSPITLENENRETKRRILHCHHCGHREDSMTHCRHCDSWNVKSYGVGIERIVEEVAALLPKRPLFRLDGDSIKDETERKKVADAFLKSGNGILIATEMLFEEPAIHAELVGVVHIDALFGVPDFRITEQLLRLFSNLRTRGKRVVLQTHFPMNQIIDAFEKDALSRFIAGELSERKHAHLPPYTVFVKCTAETRSESSARYLAEDLVRTFATLGAKAVSVPPRQKMIQGKTQWHVHVFVPHKLWNNGDSQLHRILRKLGREWTVAVDPISSV